MSLIVKTTTVVSSINLRIRIPTMNKRTTMNMLRNMIHHTMLTLTTTTTTTMTTMASSSSSSIMTINSIIIM